MTNLPDAVAALLLDMELTEEERASINPFELLDLELPISCIRALYWAEHGAMLTAHFVKRNPGQRPSRWWTYDAPRQPMGALTASGSTASSSSHGYAWAASARPSMRCSTFDRATSSASRASGCGPRKSSGWRPRYRRRADRSGGPAGFRKQAPTSAPGLLSAHERRRLPADAFEPEKVQARS